MMKVNEMHIIDIPEHKLDFKTYVVINSEKIAFRMRWCNIIETWYINIRNGNDEDVGMPIPLTPNIAIFTIDEEHGKIRTCMARPEGLPVNIGFILFISDTLTANSFNNKTAQLAIIEG